MFVNCASDPSTFKKIDEKIEIPSNVMSIVINMNTKHIHKSLKWRKYAPPLHKKSYIEQFNNEGANASEWVTDEENILKW